MIYIVEVFNRDTQEWTPTPFAPIHLTPKAACETLRWLSQVAPTERRRIQAYDPANEAPITVERESQ